MSSSVSEYMWLYEQASIHVQFMYVYACAYGARGQPPCLLQSLFIYSEIESGIEPGA